MGWVEGRYACHPNPRRLHAAAGWGWWQWGVVWEAWGVRVMLGWWHWCWHGRDGTEGG